MRILSRISRREPMNCCLFLLPKSIITPNLEVVISPRKIQDIECRVPLFWGVAVTIFLLACSRSSGPAMFTQLEPARTGIHFSNDSEEDTADESLISESLYSGGGAATGDLNNYGRKD